MVGSVAAFGKGTTTTLAVTSATPAFGDQGTTVDVHIHGSGFAAGAAATLLLHGGADAHVKTNSTTFVSSTELVANVTIAPDAPLAFWDVQVALGDKNGVGSEAFEITSAVILGSGTPGGDVNINGMSEQLQVAGFATSGGGFVYEDAGGFSIFNASVVFTIDPWGNIAAGDDATGFAVAWTRQGPGSWASQYLPRLPGSIFSRAQAAARASDGSLLLAGHDAYAASTKRNAEQFNRVAVWRQSGTSWSVQQYTLPAGSLRGSARTINGSGQVGGRIDNSATGAVWENATTSTKLDGWPNSINAAGTLIAGERNGVPVFWWRNSPTAAWNPTGVLLPSIAGATCTSGAANGINSAGVIVGSSCNSFGNAQATVWVVDLSSGSPVITGGPVALPGIGLKKSTMSDVSTAHSITETAPYTIAGGARAVGSSFRLAVRWQFR